jgi:hypothetical protein
MRMDAQQLESEARHAARPLVVRLVLTWLFMLAIGLWQAYGMWLLSGARGDVI